MNYKLARRSGSGYLHFNHLPLRVLLLKGGELFTIHTIHYSPSLHHRSLLHNSLYNCITTCLWQ